MGAEDSDVDVGNVFFTYKIDDEERHLSPEEIVAEGEPLKNKIYPFIGSNGVPQYFNTSAFDENRPGLFLNKYEDKENFKPKYEVKRRGSLAQVHLQASGGETGNGVINFDICWKKTNFR